MTLSQHFDNLPGLGKAYFLGLLFLAIGIDWITGPGFGPGFFITMGVGIIAYVSTVAISGKMDE